MAEKEGFELLRSGKMRTSAVYTVWGVIAFRAAFAIYGQLSSVVLGVRIGVSDNLCVIIRRTT